jgi:alkylation response protein AidB-like acyl-CoA dehydrogenase
MLTEDGFLNFSNMNFDVSERQVKILEQVDRACREIRPIEDRCYLEGKINDQVRTIFAKAHLLGLPIAKRYGDGQGADLITNALAMERIGREGVGPMTFFSVHSILCQMTILRWGTDEQKARLLPPATRGDTILAFGLTEPNAGSDPASLTTQFEEKEGVFTLSGQKAWISLGSTAKYALTFAYPKGKREGMCAFVVDTESPGFKAQPIKHKLGLPTSDTSTLYLDGVDVPKDNLLGPRGKGMSVALSGLMNGRLAVAAGCVGIAQDCFDESIEYERSRRRKPVAEQQLINRHIALMSTNLEAARLLVLRAAFLKQKYEETPISLEQRGATDLAITEAKYFASNVSFDTANRATQVLGVNEYTFESRPARHFADARVTMIYEGTNEILEQKMARDSLGQGFEMHS